MHTALPAPRPARARLARTLRTLRGDQSGISVVEFALCLPVLLGLGMSGIEIAYLASVNMQVSQLALSVADNASRLGQTDNSAVTPVVAETDIDAVMFGAMQQGGSLNLQDHGRVILSSLEKDTASGKQYIHWQRCAGDLNQSSSYGNDSNRNGLTGPVLTGMGKAGRQVTASTGQAVMYVEVYYDYTPLFAGWIMRGQHISLKQEAAFLVRDDRNLTGGGGDGLTGNVADSETAATC